MRATHAATGAGHRLRILIGATAFAAATLLGVTACSSGADAPAPAASTSALTGSITVFAAASLTKTFTE
ncbi:MAG TPA: molybdate-binding protein, partial [Diaminobutyricibacter sp.]